MDEHFTNNAEAAYLGSLTQEKKILFLQRQLNNCEMYSKNLQQDLEATKLTLNRLIKQRTNNEVLAKMSENLYRMERKYRQMQEILKQNNAKLLIEMQLRIQQKLQYSQKVRQLQEQIDFIRKTNKDKQQQFTIIVNKLRKYEDIRELMIENKINPQAKNQLIILEEDKSNIIKEIGQQLGRYKSIHRQYHKDLDRKIQVLAYALENNANYQDFKEEFNYMISQQTKANQLQKVVHEKMLKNSNTSKEHKKQPPQPQQRKKMNLNQSTTQLVKQIKKLVITTKILEAALNDSIQKNKQLLISQKILSQANTELKNQVQQYRKREIKFHKKSFGRGSSFKEGFWGEEIKQVQKRKGLKRSEVLQFRNGRQSINNQHQDDFTINLKNEEKQLPELIKQKRLKQYLQSLKSKDYEVNIENLYRDVHRMGQFLILCLGNRSKQAPYLKYNNLSRGENEYDKQVKNNDRNSYLKIIERNEKAKRLKNSRSLSFDQKTMNKQEREKQITNLPIQSIIIPKGNKNVSRNKPYQVGGSYKTEVGDRYRNGGRQNQRLIKKEDKNILVSLRQKCSKLEMSIQELESEQKQKGDKELRIQQF